MSKKFIPEQGATGVEESLEESINHKRLRNTGLDQTHVVYDSSLLQHCVVRLRDFVPRPPIDT